MKYTAACEWDGKECKLETTLFGVDSSTIYGGTPILKDVKELVSTVVRHCAICAVALLGVIGNEMTLHIPVIDFRMNQGMSLSNIFWLQMC